MSLFDSLPGFGGISGATGGSGNIGSGPASGFNKVNETQTFSSSETVGAQEDSIALGQGATLSFVDPGALDFADSVSERAFSYGEEAFRFSEAVIDRSVTQTAELVQKFQDEGRQSLAALVQFSTDQNKSSVQALTEDVFRNGLIAVSVLGVAALAAWAYSKRKAA